MPVLGQGDFHPLQGPGRRALEIDALAVEAGLPGYDAYSWAGFVAPAGTTPEIVQRLNAEIVKALSAPDMREAMLARGAEPQPVTPEQFAAFVRAEMAKWARVVREANIKIE